MKCQNTRRGFTLIELLVVVLIIGILSVVVVPQYQIATEKARAAEAVSNLQTIMRAQEIYFLANGNYTNDIEDLDITITAGNTYKYFCQENTHCYAKKIDGSSPLLECLVKTYPLVTTLLVRVIVYAGIMRKFVKLLVFPLGRNLINFYSTN